MTYMVCFFMMLAFFLGFGLGKEYGIDSERFDRSVANEKIMKCNKVLAGIK